MDLKNKNLVQKQAFINGKWIDASNKKEFAVFNPSTQKLIAKVSDTNPSDFQYAIDTAHEAFNGWKQIAAHERSQILRRWFELQMEHKEDLAIILATEQGKPYNEALGEIQYGASFVEWFAEEAKRVYGDTIPGHQADKRIFVINQPIGVVAAITPWNFPNAMITRKVAPALAVGCTVIIKPAEDTPLSALALAYLAKEAGFPDGVFSVLPTSNPQSFGEHVCESKTVKKISFTGSTAVGKWLIQHSAQTVKKLSLELGGNAPFIVLDDADIDTAVQGAIASKYRNAGQTCVCANRIFVQNAIYDSFIEKFKDAVSNLKVGDAFDKDVAIGPLINSDAVKKVNDLMDDALNKGAKLIQGHKQLNENTLFYAPSILSEATLTMDLAKQEIFGPIAPIFRFDSDDEVIELANTTNAGLAAYFYGTDYRRIWKLAEALEYGIVGVNTGLISTAVAPFGGIKESGFGREGSKYGIDEYLVKKYISMQV